MSAGVLLVTHPGVGAALADTAAAIIGHNDLPLAHLSPQEPESPQVTCTRGQSLIETLDQGVGVIILTDAFGATPSNIALALGRTSANPVIAGLNLPMLLRVLNYLDLPLDVLAQKALSAAQDGILDVKATEQSKQTRRHG
ncbi:MAG: PTS fructose transporter subunit IIA [Spiribacter sp.]|jgi:PTS system ascorbate-specific IIA component|nr:PTS fructose transporter subunit IIA [Spiribacter sp.]MDR9489501.1 PTS fructose transporter subunit IIA [Spiribacter sp.]